MTSTPWNGNGIKPTFTTNRPGFYTFISKYESFVLRAIVRENRAVPKDWGQPISFIFSAFKTKLIRLTLVTLTRFSGFSPPRLTTPPSFWPREALKTTKNNGNFSGLKQFFLKELVHRFFSEAKVP